MSGLKIHSIIYNKITEILQNVEEFESDKNNYFDDEWRGHSVHPNVELNLKYEKTV